MAKHDHKFLTIFILRKNCKKNTFKHFNINNISRYN